MLSKLYTSLSFEVRPLIVYLFSPVNSFLSFFFSHKNRNLIFFCTYISVFSNCFSNYSFGSRRFREKSVLYDLPPKLNFYFLLSHFCIYFAGWLSSVLYLLCNFFTTYNVEIVSSVIAHMFSFHIVLYAVYLKKSLFRISIFSSTRS